MPDGSQPPEETSHLIHSQSAT